MARGIECGLADWRVAVESLGIVDMWIVVIVGEMRMVVGQDGLRVEQVVIPIEMWLSTPMGQLSTCVGPRECGCRRGHPL